MTGPPTGADVDVDFVHVAATLVGPQRVLRVWSGSLGSDQELWAAFIE